MVDRHPDDAAVRGWAASVHALYQRATADAADPARDPVVRRQQQGHTYDAELAARCALRSWATTRRRSGCWVSA